MLWIRCDWGEQLSRERRPCQSGYRDVRAVGRRQSSRIESITAGEPGGRAWSSSRSERPTTCLRSLMRSMISDGEMVHEGVISVR